jgi:hypothetical protein
VRASRMVATPLDGGRFDAGLKLRQHFAQFRSRRGRQPLRQNGNSSKNDQVRQRGELLWRWIRKCEQDSDPVCENGSEMVNSDRFASFFSCF